MTERELLVDCLRRLNGAGLNYLLTGSMASNYWGIPRTTHDLDFVIQLPPSAVPKLVAAFRGVFGARFPISFSAGIERANFADAVAAIIVGATPAASARPLAYTAAKHAW